jgi:hypothetical protein
VDDGINIDVALCMTFSLATILVAQTMFALASCVTVVDVLTVELLVIFAIPACFTNPATASDDLLVKSTIPAYSTVACDVDMLVHIREAVPLRVAISLLTYYVWSLEKMEKCKNFC